MLIIIGWIIVLLTFISYITNDKYIYSITFLATYLSSVYISVYMWYLEQSIVQSTASFIFALYSIYLIYLVIYKNLKPQNICKMVGITGLFLLPLYSFEYISDFMIHHVISETNHILNMLGYDSIVKEHKKGYYILFKESQLKTEIVLACTGIGSISIFVGLISSINNIKWHRKIGFLMFISGLIYLLNTIRNVFIAASYGGQHLHILPELIESVFGNGGSWVSYYIADRIISQFLAAIVLIYLIVYIFNTIGKDSKIESELIYILDSTLKLYKTIRNDLLKLF